MVLVTYAQSLDRLSALSLLAFKWCFLVAVGADLETSLRGRVEDLKWCFLLDAQRSAVGSRPILLRLAMAAAAAPVPVVHNAAGRVVNSCGPRGRGILLDQLFEDYPRTAPVPGLVRFFDDNNTTYTLPANQADADMVKAAFERVRDFVVRLPYTVVETDRCPRGPDLHPTADSRLLVRAGAGGARIGSMDACVMGRGGERGGLDIKLVREGNGKALLAARPDVVHRWLAKKKRVLQAVGPGHPLHGMRFVDFVIYFERFSHVEAGAAESGSVRVSPTASLYNGRPNSIRRVFRCHVCVVPSVAPGPAFPV